MEIIDCIGSPRTRGEVHGEALRKRIASALENWEAATMAGLGRARLRILMATATTSSPAPPCCNALRR